MNGFVNDLRFGLRQLATKPGFAAAAILTLALGIGACASVFSLLNGYLFKSLPYPHSGQLVEIRQIYPKINITAGTSVPLYEDILEHASAFSGGALYGGRSFTIQTNGRTHVISGGVVTPSMFPLLGTKPLLGQTFSRNATQPGHGDVAVLSYPLWQSLYNGDPEVIGKSLRIKGKSYRVIGVMPRSFAFPNRGVKIWLPMTIAAADRAPEKLGDTHAFMIARRNPAVDAATARHELHQILAAAGKRVMAVMAAHGHKGKSQVASGFLTVRMLSLQRDLMGDRTETLLLLQLAALLLLLITCANVANLLLARILGRTHEIAMRAAVGASRWRLAWQLLIEAFCLALPGGALGAAFGWWLLTLFAKSAIGPGQSVFSLAPDWRVAAFIAAIVILTAIIVSLIPLWRLGRLDLHGLLSTGGHVMSDSRRAGSVRRALVVVQLALAAILLTGSGLLAHSLLRINAVNPGYSINNLLTWTVTVPPTDPRSGHLAEFYNNLAHRLHALQGVAAVGVTNNTLLSQISDLSGFEIRGKTVPRHVEATIQAANPGFFSTLQIPLLRGRMFDARDTENSQLVVLIDQTLAQRFFGSSNPIGQQIRLGSDQPWRTVIGVVPTVRLQSLTQPIEHGLIYIPVGQYLTMPYGTHDLDFTIRTETAPAAMIPTVRRAVHDFDPAVALTGLEPLTRTVSGLLQSRQATATLVVAFGGIALLLAVIGIYAMLSYSIHRQTNAYGVRLALGALPEDILWLVLKDGLRLLAFALAIGLGLAVLFGCLMSAQLFEVAPFDPAALIGSAVVLGAITLAACYLPARRAARLDPAVAIMEQ
ncbi:MAG TPA: ABC transporter permease [Gammaproteobacteria bacterium]|nr:ABC transporter permease [Gammaproteobacteria bacterium]